MPGFDPKTATEAQIMEHATLLQGRKLGELEDLTGSSTEVTGKGSAGLLVERSFGITANALSIPDFEGAGIELKVVPVVHGSKGDRRIKERTVISMIDYTTIIDETWETAHVRSKLDLLLVFYEVTPGEPIDTFPILRVIRWKPDQLTQPLIHHDWEAIHAKVAEGHAEDLTESEGYVLGACTKGPGGGMLRTQPRSSTLASSRAFALKPTFMLNLLLDAERRDLPGLRDLHDLQARYARFVGGTVGALAEEVGVAPSTAKNWAATVVRRGIAFAAEQEVERLGLTVRVPRIDPDLRPYEAVSFPSFRHVELVEEDWNDSLLLSYIEYMLLAPVMGRTKATLPSRCVIVTPVYWTPTQDELSLIQEEWTMFRDLIREGRARDLPSASATKAIHIRTKGRDSQDLDELPDGTSITKKSFWLNIDFVQELLTCSVT